MLANHNIQKEAVMVILTQGRYTRQYVACCATGKCGYFGELLETSIALALLTEDDP